MHRQGGEVIDQPLDEAGHVWLLEKLLAIHSIVPGRVVRIPRKAVRLLEKEVCGVANGLALGRSPWLHICVLVDMNHVERTG
jgi:hypothetical protein